MSISIEKYDLVWYYYNKRGEISLDIYIKFVLVMSLITLVIYGIDKARAADSKTRIPEITLLTMSALGGALGAFLGRLFFNHKRNAASKAHFSVVIYVSLILQLGFYVFLILVKNGDIVL